jgi:hypothetical protein
MAREHGARGRVYLGITSAGTAEAVAFQNGWTFNAVTDKQDVTSFGDTNKAYVVGLPDASGTFSGFFDDATQQAYTAASDGVARKFYLYPNIAQAPGTYWFGTVFPDFSTAGGVSGAVTTSSNWVAASSIIRVG